MLGITVGFNNQNCSTTNKSIRILANTIPVQSKSNFFYAQSYFLFKVLEGWRLVTSTSLLMEYKIFKILILKTVLRKLWYQKQ